MFHSPKARSDLDQWRIGKIKGDETPDDAHLQSGQGSGDGQAGSSTIMYLVPLLAVGAALYYQYGQ